MLRHLIVLSFAAVAVAATGARAQDACDPATFQNTCDAASASSVDVCQDPEQDGTGVTATVDCSTEAAGAICSDGPDCDGPGCADITGKTCASPVGGACLGFSQLLQGGNPDAFGALLCEGDGTCKTDSTGDNCVAHEGGTCADGAADAGSCQGSVLSFCIPFQATSGTLVFASNIEIDCALLSFDGTNPAVCGVQTCQCDAQCGTGGTCTGGQCAGGTFCVNPNPDPADCAGGEGEGEGEGEGDGGDACQADSDCGRDRVCTDGQCVAADDGGGENPPLCGNLGTAGTVQVAAFGLVLGLVPMFRRRRR